MQRFRKQSEIAAPAEVVFGWHELPDAFEKLTPPWEHVRVLERSAPGIAKGTRVTMEMRIGPFKQPWVAVHTDYEAGRMFRDQQESGPFRSWIHTHIVEPRGPHRAVLTDEIEYKLPLGLVGQILGGWFMRRKLERLFEYRHRVTRKACEGSAMAFGQGRSQQHF